MTYLSGKGYYIWKAINCMAGRPQEIADAAFAADLGHVLIKIADGVFRYNVDVDLPAIVAALQAEGIEVWGWQYIYGSNPAGEAAIAIRQIQATGVTGFVVNAEREFKASGMGSRARTYMQALRNGVGDLPIALSTYRFPSYHPQFPFTAFLDFCDVAMPQVYWLYSHDPVQQLARTLAEYYQLTTLPVIPTGAAWKQNAWQSTPADVTAFLQAAEMAGCQAANFWSWDASQHLPTWQAIATYDWPGPAEPEPPEEEDMSELSEKIDQVLDNLASIMANQDVTLTKLSEILDDLMTVLDLLEPADAPPVPPTPPPPAPTYQVRVTRNPVANAFVESGKNAKGFLILTPLEPRVQYAKDRVLAVTSAEALDVDGSYNYFRLAGSAHYLRADHVERI